MNTLAQPTLSQHLLDEANRFMFYPVRSRRDRTTLAAQKTLDAAMTHLLEWRKTFVPDEHRTALEILWSNPTLLDQIHSRQLLTAVPDIVERTLALRSLTLAGIPDAESLAYLREAANSYILGLPLATVALSRAAVERSLKQACAKRFGARAVDEASLDEVIERFAPRVLSKSACVLANTVRKKGNDVLHPKGRTTPSLQTALQVLEAARDVLQQVHRV